MTQIPNELTRNFADPAVRRRLMEEYADCRGFQGKNENDEIVWVSISSNEITVATYQSNGWVRVNYYDENGLASGEAYNGRWNKPEPEEDAVWLIIENWYEDGAVYVTTFKTHEAASVAFQRLKAGFDADEVAEGAGEFFHVFGQMNCEVKRSVIQDV